MKNSLLTLTIIGISVVVGVLIGYYLGYDHGFEKSVKSKTSGIKGIVLLGPTCPVVQDPPDPACADKPYQTRLAITTGDGSRVIKELNSDTSGNFYVSVPPGVYAIRSAAAANVLPYCSSNDVIKVNANQIVETIVSCDTGIR